MAIAVQGTQTLGESASATSVVCAYPSGIQAGEVLLAKVTVSNAAISGTPPAGWTLALEHDNVTANTVSSAVFYKIATGSESGNLTFNGAPANGRITATIERWSGVDTTTPLDVTPISKGSANANTFTTNAITTVTANSVLVYIISHNSSAGSLHVSSSGGLTKIGNGPTASTGREQAIFYETVGAAGSQAGETFGYNTGSSQWGSITVALRPSAGSAFSGSSGLSGSGTQSRSAAPGLAGSVALSGSGTLSPVQTGMHAMGAGAVRTGSGTLTISGVAGFNFSGSVALSGSGTQSRSVASLSVTATASFSGAGTQASSRVVGLSGSVTASGSGSLGTVGALASVGAVSLSGSGGLAISVKAGFTSSVALSGAGNGALNNSSLSFTTSRALTGSGTLSRAVTAGATGTVSFTGAGSLGRSASVGFADTRALTGSGSLTASPQTIWSVNFGLSGSGTQTRSGKPTFASARALSGAGALGIHGVPGWSGAVSLSGVGYQDVDGEIPWVRPTIDMSNIEAVPYLTINGVEMPTATNQGSVLVLEGLTIDWGRQSHLDEARAASLTVTLWDRDGEWSRGQDFLGLEITAGVRFTDKQGVDRDFKNFRGRIIEAEAVERTRDYKTGTEYGYFVSITATDKLSELGNRLITNQSWTTESYLIRRDRIASYLVGVVNGVGGSYVAGQLQFAPQSFDSKSALELIEEHISAGCEFVNYDPDTNVVGTYGRMPFVGSGWSGLKLAEMETGSGVYGIQSDASNFYVPGNRRDYNVDAGSLVPTSGIKRSIDSSITAVFYEYVNNTTTGAKTTYVVGTGLDENTYGRRALSIRTTNANTNVVAFTGNYVGMAQDNLTWLPPDLEWDTRIPERGIQSYAQARSFLSGRVVDNPLFLSRNKYNRFASKVPVYRVIGGRMTYEADGSGDMGWVIQPNFGPIAFDPVGSPVTWAALNPGVPVVSWAQLDDNVTWDDLRWIDTGV